MGLGGDPEVQSRVDFGFARTGCWERVDEEGYPSAG